MSSVFGSGQLGLLEPFSCGLDHANGAGAACRPPLVDCAPEQVCRPSLDRSALGALVPCEPGSL